jgi:Pentapeptide repeats (8 copies)
MIRRPTMWLVAMAITAVLALLLLCVLVFPRLLHPPLSPVQLQSVASADRRVELQQAQARLQNDARATLLQGVAGVLLVVGVVATWRQVHVSREGQITERFARAIDHLGSDSEDVRLGGVYTLERIAKDSPADRRTVHAVLRAFVHNHAPWPVGTPEGPEQPSKTVDEQLPWLQHRLPDVQAAMTVLGRRLPSRDPLDLYLSWVDLRRAYLSDAWLAGTEMRHANLARAWMRRVHLEDSDLGHTDLREARMEGARLTRANLSQACLQGAQLIGADLRDAKLIGADLRDANLNGARLDGADLTDAHVDSTTVWPEGFKPT